jgi:hypothetical protein
MRLLIALLFCFSIGIAQQNNHPNLMLTKTDVEIIKSSYSNYPLFQKTLEESKLKMDKILVQPIDVPIPKDAASYTHERHKTNGFNIQTAGILYQILEEEKYAEYVKSILLQYAKLYPTLKKHPAATSNSYGLLFWQSLNETVWLIYAVQAYDCIYNYLSESERTIIETNLFRKMADFFLNEQIHTFNLAHNHGTWMTAAVGMTGFVINDSEYVEKSINGSNKDGNGGFLNQLDNLFSPDGFYTEGAYYHRYAIQPFFIFAESIHNNRASLNIYSYRNSILKKTFYTLLQLTNTDGTFIPINDAIKGKSDLSPEIVTALNLTFYRFGNDASLLAIANRQNKVLLNGAGLAVAKAVANKKEVSPFDYQSVFLSDGKDGKSGGVSILRHGPTTDQSMLVMKYTGHGLSHGHYDKLSFLYYNQSREIIQDYGAARFVNIENKYGGRYLPENKSFAMHSIAHNTISVDEKCQFDGDIKISSKYHSTAHFHSTDDQNFQIISAKDEYAYEGVEMQRTMAMISDPSFANPIIIDVFKVESEMEHQYDLPFYYLGQIMHVNQKYKRYSEEQTILGNKPSYNHLWKEAELKVNGMFLFKWLNGERFYSIITNTDTATTVYFVRIGANDPNFNLRSDPGIIIRTKAKEKVFASIIEQHGRYDKVNEITTGENGIIESVTVLSSDKKNTVVEVRGKKNLRWILLINNGESSETEKHSVIINNEKYEWTGNYKLIKK